jgi:hypothetical protein
MLNQTLECLNPSINRRLITSSVLTLSIAIAPATLARYVSPPHPTSPRIPTQSTGTRGGCEALAGLPLTLLAPKKQVGQTVSLHPTFVWFVPDTKPLPLEFRLFEVGPNEQLKLTKKIAISSSPGIMKLSLPENEPSLAVGSRYLWQVAIFCNPNHPSTASVAKAEFLVVETPAALRQALATTSNPSQRREIYANAGLWYDALSEALETATSSKLGKAVSSLLEDLAQLEEPEQSMYLRQIARGGS